MTISLIGEFNESQYEKLIFVSKNKIPHFNQRLKKNIFVFINRAIYLIYKGKLLTNKSLIFSLIVHLNNQKNFSDSSLQIEKISKIFQDIYETTHNPELKNQFQKALENYTKGNQNDDFYPAQSRAIKPNISHNSSTNSSCVGDKVDKKSEKKGSGLESIGYLEETFDSVKAQQNNEIPQTLIESSHSLNWQDLISQMKKLQQQKKHHLLSQLLDAVANQRSLKDLSPQGSLAVVDFLIGDSSLLIEFLKKVSSEQGDFILANYHEAALGLTLNQEFMKIKASRPWKEILQDLEVFQFQTSFCKCLVKEALMRKDFDDLNAQDICIFYCKIKAYKQNNYLLSRFFKKASNEQLIALIEKGHVSSAFEAVMMVNALRNRGEGFSRVGSISLEFQDRLLLDSVLESLPADEQHFLTLFSQAKMCKRDFEECIALVKNTNGKKAQGVLVDYLTCNQQDFSVKEWKEIYSCIGQSNTALYSILYRFSLNPEQLQGIASIIVANTTTEHYQNALRDLVKSTELESNIRILHSIKSVFAETLSLWLTNKKPELKVLSEEQIKRLMPGELHSLRDDEINLLLNENYVPQVSLMQWPQVLALFVKACPFVNENQVAAVAAILENKVPREALSLNFTQAKYLYDVLSSFKGASNHRFLVIKENLLKNLNGSVFNELLAKKILNKISWDLLISLIDSFKNTLEASLILRVFKEKNPENLKDNQTVAQIIDLMEFFILKMSNDHRKEAQKFIESLKK